MSRLKLGQCIIVETDGGHQSRHMLVSVPDKNRPEGFTSVNLVNLSNGNRWNDELFLVPHDDAYRNGVKMSFIINVIVDLDFARVYKD